MDPVIPADILVTTVIAVLVGFVVGGPLMWLLTDWLAEGSAKARERLMRAARARTRRTVEDSKSCGGYPWGQAEANDDDTDSGDQGGVPIPVEPHRAAKRPRAPDTGSGLLDGVGRPTAGQKIIAGLEDAVAHARGDSSRAKVTRRAGD